MIETEKRAEDKRDIVVTIDAAAQALPAIALAVALASARRQALHGLFLEDEDLLKVARLPFSREIHRMGGPARVMSDLKLERAMARLAEEFRSNLERQATQLAVTWSYSRMPGSRWRVTRTAGRNVGLLVIAAPGDQPAPAREQILVLDWDRPGVLKALASVLDTSNKPVEVMLAGSGDSAPVRQLLEAYPNSRLRLLGELAPDIIFRSNELRPGLVLAASDTTPERLERCLRLARCPVLVAK
jgi:hypothetical protein